jgi:hypothetical protein
MAPRIVRTNITNGSPERKTIIFIFHRKLFHNLRVSCCGTGIELAVVVVVVVVVVFALFRLNVPVIPGSSSKCCSDGL